MPKPVAKLKRRDIKVQKGVGTDKATSRVGQGKKLKGKRRPVPVMRDAVKKSVAEKVRRPGAPKPKTGVAKVNPRGQARNWKGSSAKSGRLAKTKGVRNRVRVVSKRLKSR